MAQEQKTLQENFLGRLAPYPAPLGRLAPSPAPLGRLQPQEIPNLFFRVYGKKRFNQTLPYVKLTHLYIQHVSVNLT